MSDTFTPLAPLQTAVLFLVFNRPDTTAQVFEAIRQAKPPRLYVASDGPRANREGEAEKVAKVRDIASAVDWPCDVKLLFREVNLGCKFAVSSGITWFFEQEDQGIILEDDCLPSQSFFWFCESMLNRYANDYRIWHVSGASTLEERDLLNDDSYYFSKHNHIWGWATWSSRWQSYDLHLAQLSLFERQNTIKNLNFNPRLARFWVDQFRLVASGSLDTWDYQWDFSVWINGGLSIIPTKNLISNIGFGLHATHTLNSDSKLANKPISDINLDLVHPSIMMPNIAYEQITEKNLFDMSPSSYFKMKLKRLIKFLFRGLIND